ncbi:MAG: hypothetical protein V2I67_15710 [Thermoanaerobaculales bacterium]|jgi:hypothetical protein|nr:hypothetical protein [Thermoanaerobaculales bacterium]
MKIRTTIAGLAAMVAFAASGPTEELVEGEFQGWSKAVRFDTSPPLRSMEPRLTPAPPHNLEDPEAHDPAAYGPQDDDGALQSRRPDRDMPSPLISFDGTPNVLGYTPPDSMGDVGYEHYVAMTNVYFSIYDKSGNLLYGPAANNTLWSGFGGRCEFSNDGDPIVLHDQMSNRWILTQFTAGGPDYYNCVAVSTTSDPTGSYYRYAFATANNYFPDYPKYGVWPDALYISTREFEYIGTSGYYRGVGAYAIEREELIAGDPNPTMIEFFVPRGATPATVGDGLLPADMDGNTRPPVGSPNFYVGSMDDGATYNAPQDALTLWEFAADFDVPANSTFAQTATLPTASFDSIFPCNGRDCIPQPGTTNKVDILSYRQRPMHRLAYRNFGTHEALVTNQSVEASTAIAGIRWWEIRDPGGSPVIHQEGTFGPGDTDGIHRWMGSVAMDNAGNLALGYSASDGTATYPSVWYAGRLATDPSGTLPQGEGSIIDGAGSQTLESRWGDYTSMNVDPSDDCTFWYINQYMPTSHPRNWQMRIGAFKFDECTPAAPSVFNDGFESGGAGAWSRTSP